MTRNNQCTIVTYHYVRPIKTSKHQKIKGLEFNDFIKQIKFLKSHFHFITLEQLLDCIYNNKELPTNSMILTFDDGLKDHYQYVFPLLQKFDIQGLFFPSAKPLITKSVLDVHKIHFILANCKNVNDLISDIFWFVRKHKIDWHLKDPSIYFEKLAIPNRFDQKEIIFIKRILQRELPEQLRSIIVKKLFSKYVTKNEQLFHEKLYLSIDDIKEMMEFGMYFGSHGYSHDWFSFLPIRKIQTEIKKSKEFCTKIGIDQNYLTFCYPFGNYNDIVIKELKKYGFKAAFTVIANKTKLVKSNAFTLERYDTNDIIK